MVDETEFDVMDADHESRLADWWEKDLEDIGCITRDQIPEEVDILSPDSPTGSKEPNFKGFADGMIQIAFEGGDADGATIQEEAERFGLIKQITRTEPCCEECECSMTESFPLECFVRVYT